MSLCDAFLQDLYQSVATASEQKKGDTSSSSSSDAKLVIEKLVAAQVSILCRQCDNNGPEGNARAYITENPVNIVLCSNRLQNEKNLQEALVHEATHAFDFLHQRCDFYSCDGLAYSEVRAARNAECSTTWPPFLRKYCVKKNARRATDNLYPLQGEKCVDRVFDRAYADMEPT